MRKLSIFLSSAVCCMLILTPPAVVYGNLPTKEETLVTLTNEERKTDTQTALTYDAVLSQAAALRAQEIADFFSHTRPNGSSWSTAFGQFGIAYTAAGENLAYGQVTPQEAIADWMASPGHKENILNPSYTKTGTAIYIHEDTYYWVQLFISD